MATATLSCVVSPRDAPVIWYFGEGNSKTEIKSSERFVIQEDYKTRSITVKDCIEEDRFVHSYSSLFILSEICDTTSLKAY